MLSPEAIKKIAKNYLEEITVYKSLKALNTSPRKKPGHKHNFRKKDLLDAIGMEIELPKTYACSTKGCSQTAYFCKICDGYILGMPREEKYDNMSFCAGSKGDKYSCAHNHEIGRVVRVRS